MLTTVTMQTLHFNNNKDSNYDQNGKNRKKLHKVCLCVNCVNATKKVDKPGNKFSVGGLLVLFKG